MFTIFRSLRNIDKEYYDPTDFINIDKAELQAFKRDDKKVGRVIGSLSIYPELIYPIIINSIDYPHVSNNAFTININKNNKGTRYKSDMSNIKTNMEKFVDDLYNDDVRYVMIRLVEGGVFIDHASCIIIDKIQKYILFFDSKNNAAYDPSLFKFVIDIVNGSSDNKIYRIVYSGDTGYDNNSSLQGYNHYCQTYILYILMLIANNPDVEYGQFKQLFEEKITTKKLGHFLFAIYKKIKNNDSIKNLEYNARYPSGTIINFINSVVFMMGTIGMSVVVKVFPKIHNDNEIEYVEDNDCILLL
jgi:hypothetical protein